MVWESSRAHRSLGCKTRVAAPGNGGGVVVYYGHKRIVEVDYGANILVL